MKQSAFEGDDIFLREQLIQLVRRLFGNRVEIAGLTPLNQDEDYLVLRIKLKYPNQQVVIKLAGEGSHMANAFDRTAMLHHLVRQRTSVPVPEILAVDISAREFPWRYLVLAHITGEQWQQLRARLPGDELARAYYQVGEAVAELHTIDFPSFGELSVDGNVRFAGLFPEALAERARISIRHPHLIELFSSVLQQCVDRFVGVSEARLTHEDLHGYNLLFHRRAGQLQLAAVLDFDKAWAGHAEIDLARMEFWRGMTNAAFWEAYKAIHPIDPGYEARRPIYQLLWCYEYARSTPQHYADTRRLCEQNDFPYPEAFKPH